MIQKAQTEGNQPESDVDEEGQILEGEEDEYEMEEETSIDPRLLQSGYDSLIEGSSVISDAKGYYDMSKLTSRHAKHHSYMAEQPIPHDNRFCNVDSTPVLPKVPTVIPFEHTAGRNPTKIKKEFFSSPNYDPLYSLTMKKASSVPMFNKLLGRKPEKKPKYCSNDYELQGSD